MNSWKSHINNHIGSVMTINLVLAAVAFVKDLLYAVYFGTTAAADALGLAYFIADTPANALLATTLGVACVPKFAKLMSEGRQGRLRRTIRNLIGIVAAVTLLLALGLALNARVVIARAGPGLAPDAAMMGWQLLLIMLPIIVIFPVAAVFSSILQVGRRFNPPAWAPVLFNVVLLFVIASAYGLNIPHSSGVYVFAVSIVTGAIMMLLFTWYAYLRMRDRLFFVDGLAHEGEAGRPPYQDIKEISRNFVPYLLILAGTQSVLLVERYLASGLGTGVVAGLNYAYRVSQFPIWVFVAAVTAVVLPTMSHWIAVRDWEQLRKQMITSFLCILAITVPTAVLFYMAREPIISLLFQRGSFDHSSSATTAALLAGYALSIVPQGISAIILRFYLALGMMGAPLIIFFISSVANIWLDVYFVRIWGSAGLGYGAACGWGINALMLIFYLFLTLKSQSKDKGVVAYV